MLITTAGPRPEDVEATTAANAATTATAAAEAPTLPVAVRFATTT